MMSQNPFRIAAELAAGNQWKLKRNQWVVMDRLADKPAQIGECCAVGMLSIAVLRAKGQDEVAALGQGAAWAIYEAMAPHSREFFHACLAAAEELSRQTDPSANLPTKEAVEEWKKYVLGRTPRSEAGEWTDRTRVSLTLSTSNPLSLWFEGCDPSEDDEEEGIYLLPEQAEVVALFTKLADRWDAGEFIDTLGGPAPVAVEPAFTIELQTAEVSESELVTV